MKNLTFCDDSSFLFKKIKLEDIKILKIGYIYM